MPDGYEAELTDLRAGRDVSFLDLHSIDQVSLEDAQLVFELARAFKRGKTAKLTLCKGRSQVNAFFESSTRTMSSFDLAAKNLGMDTTSVGSASATKKGESFLDTVETLGAYNVRIIVIRSAESGVPEMVARHVGASVLNAGDGWHEHPTQGLLDALTMLDHFGSTDLKGRVVTIVGDITHSRVFGSLVRIARKLGADERAIAPKWSTGKATLILFLTTVAVAVLSEILVGAITPVVQSYGWTELFIGVIIVAFIGNIAEHLSAVTAAIKNKMDLSIQIAVGSATQIVMFVAPLLVLLSLFWRPMNLVFNTFELVSIIFAVFVTNAVVEDGESTWFEGFQLLVAYVIIAVAFFFHP